MQAVKLKMASVKNISKITKAMQMVAASKLTKAQKRVEGGRPFAASLKEIFGSLEKSEENPEGYELSAKSECLIPITSDKGLCGGVNSVLIKGLQKDVMPQLEEAGVDVKIVAVGEKGRSLLRRAYPEKINAVATGTFSAIPPNFAVAAIIAEEALETDADNFKVCYNVFKSMISQIPAELNVPSYQLIAAEGTDPFVKFETEDERTETFENFCEFNLAVALYGAMLENNCSEIASRMSAMDNATKNADKAFDALELKYNKARQAAITTELIEIISGAESLKG
jgi:F-type H+-transporting ATPase subunit gamma